MKTSKFSYSVELIEKHSGGVSFEKVACFPLLAMARQYCLFNRGHYRIVCIGFIEYFDGLEVSK